MQRSRSFRLAFSMVGLTFWVVVGLFTGSAAAQIGYWHTSGNQILDSSGHVVRIAGYQLVRIRNYR